MTGPKIKVHRQGTATIENVDGDWLVLFPTGRIKAFATMIAANKAAERWFKRNAHSDAINVGAINIDPNE